eukprot:3547768-Rhodomonas_salina.2
MSEAERAGVGTHRGDVTSVPQSGEGGRMAHQKEGTNESTPLMSLQPGAEGPIHTEPGGREDAGGTADAASSRGRGGEGDESEEWERRWESHSGGMERIHEEASQNPPRLSVPNRVNQVYLTVHAVYNTRI